MMFAALSIAVIIIDQIAKLAVSSLIPLGSSVPVIEGIFHFTYVRNRGAAFGLFEGSRWISVLAAVVIIAVIIYLRQRIAREPLLVRAAVAMLVGGTIGNLIDRILYGYVIDFFDFRVWPVFNIADIGICVGVGCLIYAVMTSDDEKNDESAAEDVRAAKQ